MKNQRKRRGSNLESMAKKVDGSSESENACALASNNGVGRKSKNGGKVM